MPGFLLDTNILSEVRKGPRRSRPEVYTWWLGMADKELFLSVLTLGEIRKGIERLRSKDPMQAIALESWLTELKRGFGDRILGISTNVAEGWGRLQALRPLPEIDALLAATTMAHDLVLVTRNENDFAGLGLQVLNPFHG